MGKKSNYPGLSNCRDFPHALNSSR